MSDIRHSSNKVTDCLLNHPWNCEVTLHVICPRSQCMWYNSCLYFLDVILSVLYVRMASIMWIRARVYNSWEERETVLFLIAYISAYIYMHYVEILNARATFDSKIFDQYNAIYRTRLASRWRSMEKNGSGLMGTTKTNSIIKFGKLRSMIFIFIFFFII